MKSSFKYQLTETSKEEFVQTSVSLLAEKIVTTLDQQEDCIFGLSGGSTPRPVYEQLGMRDDIDWSRVKIYLIDERYIEPHSEDSNQKLVRDSLLAQAGILPEHCYFPDTTLPLDQCVMAYMHSLVDLFAEHAADINVLGMGNDGHIASLFPPVPEYAFGEQVVINTTTDDFAVRDRISVSPLVLMASQAHFLLLKGNEKKAVFEECAAAELDPTRWPLHVALATGKVSVVLG